MAVEKISFNFVVILFEILSEKHKPPLHDKSRNQGITKGAFFPGVKPVRRMPPPDWRQGLSKPA
jgi:hypothetical protein